MLVKRKSQRNELVKVTQANRQTEDCDAPYHIRSRVQSRKYLEQIVVFRVIPVWKSDDTHPLTTTVTVTVERAAMGK